MLSNALFALATTPNVAFAEDPEDKVILFAAGDPELNAAIAKARAGLPEFWRHFASPTAGEGGFSLKLALSDGDRTEHFWCTEIEGDAAKATCQIANDPEVVDTVELGQRIAVEPPRISDWMYRLDGKIKGGETIRVIVKRLPPEEAAPYRDMLAEE